MSGNLYELSDCLFQFRRWFLQKMASGAGLTPEQIAGTPLTPEEVEMIGELLFASGRVALKHAHEIARHRWQEARSQLDVAALVDEAMEPGSNVVLLSGFLHPQASDGAHE